MSKGFAIALAAALIFAPCTAVVSIAEDSQAEPNHSSRDQTKDCCDENENCIQDSECKYGKCKDCKHGACSGDSCITKKCEKADCTCAATACASCDKSACQDANVYAGCSQADCASAKGCCKSLGKSLAFGACRGNCECPEESALSIRGLRLFAAPPSATSEAAWQIIAEEIIRTPTRCCDSDASNESVYLILNSVTGGDYAIETQIGQGSTVGRVLQGAILPHPVNYASAEITVHRSRSVVNDDATIEAEEKIFPVRWDEATGQPTKCTDHALQPNDRLCVKLAGATEDASNTVAVESPTASASTIHDFLNRPRRESNEEGLTLIQYNIHIIEDCRGCLAEYEALRNGAPMMFAESKTILPAMRMLHKHQLIRQLSSPKVICAAGQTAELEISGQSTADGAKEWEGVRLEMAAEEAASGLMLELAVRASEHKRCFEVRTALLVEPGQTIVLNANAVPAPEGETQPEQAAVYVVVTPELVQSK